ncbi:MULTISPECIES: hypothetical protein [Clostridia]|uniref:hypothetical protein n=1 Tax=Clostridium sp. CCUG 7971 TaxID=2811414 RepID=UPI001ABAE021|nr:hypothetical protein [Clostridium sp. CCUG 7971]MBO3443682.1 hypothetical protein [Clostridium sp. CCUG 7971]
MENMNGLKRDVKDTAKKAKYMAKEVAEDVKDNFEGAMHIMESKKDEMMDRFEQKKFAAQIKQQMKKENK